MRLITDLAQRQLSRLELALVVIVLGVLVFAGYQRLDALGAQAEATALEVTIQNMRTALLADALVAHARGESQRIPQLAGSNPMGLMQAGYHPLLEGSAGERPPRRYLGAFADTDPALVEGGRWYFDATRAELVYRVRHAHYFRSALDGPARVRLQVEADEGSALGVRLRVLDRYEWNL